MRARQILVIVLAFVVAAGAALFARNYFRAQPQPVVQQTAAPAPVQQREVLVAATPIQIGVFLKEDSLVWQPWPGEEPPAFYFVRGGDTDKPALVGGIARRAFNAGEPITRGDIIRPTDSGFLAAVMKPGQRAVSIDVSASSIVAGLVAPGDLVDVILINRIQIQNVSDGQRGEVTAGETVLRGVRILAMDQRLSSRMPVAEDGGQQQAQGGAGVPRTVTLEVSPKDAERLSVASRLGELTLSLRAFARDTGIGDAGPEEANATPSGGNLGTMMDAATPPGTVPASALSGGTAPSGVPGLPAPAGGIGTAPPAPSAAPGQLAIDPATGAPILPFTPDTDVSSAISFIAGPFGTQTQQQQEQKAREEKPTIVILRGASRQAIAVQENEAEMNRAAAAAATAAVAAQRQSTTGAAQGAAAAGTAAAVPTR
ncbi:Flp pilus assembly protein CpaB [Zavarzinia sp. CC-PAN008]|uniref:Flp pilus assembly protein CpaB n=1 Tax=Zavarzinia sp. CC-PAN008 TaxID=3243332 RepID=UPI003F748BB7